MALYTLMQRPVFGHAEGPLESHDCQPFAWTQACASPGFLVSLQGVTVSVAASLGVQE